MAMGSRLVWEAPTVVEALGASQAVLWTWEPDLDRLRLTGAAHALGLGELCPECSAAAIRGLAHDRSIVEDLLAIREPGSPISTRLRLRSGAASLWSGSWLEEGVRAAGFAVVLQVSGAVQPDPLTGLLDRRSFLAEADKRLSTPGFHDLVVADLNRFRRLNEALGHNNADQILVALGSRLSAAFPPEAAIGRIGDDEFAIITPAREGDPAAILHASLERPLRVAGFDIFPALCTGSVRVGGGAGAQDTAEVMRRAESALEAAKLAGSGGAVGSGSETENDGLSRLVIESDLRGAIGRGEIESFFQPIVRLSTGELSGFEALARWRHPRKGLLAPDAFLDVMSELGLIAELGAHMMRSAARQLRDWRQAHPSMSGMTISVNLSTGEIDREGLVEEVAALVRRHDLPRGALKLEITEGDIMRDPDRAAVTLKALRDAGAALALDDFGTGFSSLAYLTRLPFDTLKIDRYFVRTMATNEGSAKIVQSVIKLGQDLDLEVVAEGVENAVMARQLLEIGCDYGQGFGYAPALSAQEAEVYLNESYADGSAPLKAVG
ncbi:MAG TPA: bifunctional diguanylate cyclase/phosphodiesterase [Caulobacteraceae bacterium]